MVQSDQRIDAIIGQQEDIDLTRELTMTTLLEFKHVSKQYSKDTRALSDVNFAVKEGEFLSIIGPSGAGKSTLLRCINRMIDASSGEIMFETDNIMNYKKVS